MTNTNSNRPRFKRQDVWREPDGHVSAEEMERHLQTMVPAGGPMDRDILGYSGTDEFLCMYRDTIAEGEPMPVFMRMAAYLRFHDLGAASEAVALLTERGCTRCHPVKLLMTKPVEALTKAEITELWQHLRQRHGRVTSG